MERTAIQTARATLLLAITAQCGGSIVRNGGVGHAPCRTRRETCQVVLERACEHCFSKESHVQIAAAVQEAKAVFQASRRLQVPFLGFPAFKATMGLLPMPG